MLFSTSRAAEECVSFILRHTTNTGTSREKLRIIHTPLANIEDGLCLYIVIFPSHEWRFAKLFWQHAGMGISSRYAEACLRLLSYHNALPEIRGDLYSVMRLPSSSQVYLLEF